MKDQLGASVQIKSAGWPGYSQFGKYCYYPLHWLVACGWMNPVKPGLRVPLGESAWLDVMRPKDITPNIFDLSKRRNWSILMALHNNFWIYQVEIGGNLTVNHLLEFINLWGEAITCPSQSRCGSYNFMEAHQ